jgi:hypothetical protein
MADLDIVEGIKWERDEIVQELRGLRDKFTRIIRDLKDTRVPISNVILHDYGIQIGGTNTGVSDVAIFRNKGILVELDSRWTPGNSNYIGCASPNDTGFIITIFDSSRNGYDPISVKDPQEQLPIVQKAITLMESKLHNIRVMIQKQTKNEVAEREARKTSVINAFLDGHSPLD